MLADLAKIADMDHKEHVKFKVLTDLRVKVREKVLRDPDMTLDDMTILVADVEAMDIVNNSLKHDQPKVTPGNGKKTKEDAMQAQGEVKPGKTVKPKKKNEDKLRRKLPDEAYKMGCWICGGEHRREMCDAEKSAMLCNICGKEASHVTAVCLQQFAGATAAGQPPGRPSTPGFQSGMVAMEERRYKKRSYAQVAGGSALGAVTPSSPSPPLPSPAHFLPLVASWRVQ